MSPDHVVEVQLRNGTTVAGYVDAFRWVHDNNNWDIVKYRIVK
ncbi:hypothetical protein NOU17_23095 [Salmonella enterica subsp. enterica serovar Typhimurium]|nr:hypothetical protein [Salmonella enterica]MCR8589412.1 hypothetical protein [Salmonella enterica subsp. enterica serovar Typhimurium]MCR8603261.1 hypothetical protein [Salmonella enterica subsp. enterica serovar Typhimurium]MCR8607495.1 hypothetical protein [Salmonella enterica subsp. enterica serovar Typhimurium]